MRPEVIKFADEMPVRALIWNVEQYPYHWHNALEIIYVLQGQAKVVMGGETHLLAENNIAVINVDELHSIHKSDGFNKLLIIQIDPAFCAGINPGYKNSLFYCCSTYHEAEAPEKYDVLKSHIAHLACLLSEDPCKNHPANIKNCIEEILSHLIDSFDYLRFGTGITAFKDKQVYRFKSIYEHILNSPAERPSLMELAKVSGISLQHLSHDIKEKFGLTFQELVHYSRCEKAAKLLLSTDKMIYEISFECGFSDPKYLIKSFRLFYHCTPSEFRKMYWANDETLASQVQYRETPLFSALEYSQIFKYLQKQVIS